MKLHYTDQFIRDYTLKLDSLYKKIQEEERKLFPSTVYHYTSHTGLLGILESKVFWATDARFVNDTKEMAYGSDVLAGQIQEHIKATSDEMLRFFWENVALVFKQAHTIFEMYVVSFCEFPDDNLPVWTMYANDGKGFNIGIKKGYFDRFLDPTIKRKLVGWVLGKVNYSPDDIINRVRELCRITDRYALSFLQTKTTNSHDANKVFRHLASQLVVKLLPEICLLKHPHYQFEKEFRIVGIASIKSTSNLLHMNGNRPYIKSDIFLPSDIENVWFGPALHDDAEIQEKIKSELLSISDKYCDIPLKRSSISYRATKQ